MLAMEAGVGGPYGVLGRELQSVANAEEAACRARDGEDRDDRMMFMGSVAGRSANGGENTSFNKGAEECAGEFKEEPSESVEPEDGDRDEERESFK